MAPEAPPTDGELLRRTARADREAFSQLYARHEAIVAAYLVRASGTPRSPPI